MADGLGQRLRLQDMLHGHRGRDTRDRKRNACARKRACRRSPAEGRPRSWLRLWWSAWRVSQRRRKAWPRAPQRPTRFGGSTRAYGRGCVIAVGGSTSCFGDLVCCLSSRLSWSEPNNIGCTIFKSLQGSDCRSVMARIGDAWYTSAGARRLWRVGLWGVLGAFRACPVVVARGDQAARGYVARPRAL